MCILGDLQVLCCSITNWAIWQLFTSADWEETKWDSLHQLFKYIGYLFLKRMLQTLWAGEALWRDARSVSLYLQPACPPCLTVPLPGRERVRATVTASALSLAVAFVRVLFPRLVGLCSAETGTVQIAGVEKLTGKLPLVLAVVSLPYCRNASVEKKEWWCVTPCQKCWCCFLEKLLFQC